MDLSVIIPAYNAQHTIARCVESVLSSSKYLLEIIIVDDGSTDDTLTLLCNLQQKYSNIVVLTQKNAGPSSARRLGLTRASGSYITFVDSDDYLETCAYDKLLDVLSSTNVDLLEFGYKRINVDGKATKIYHHTALSLKNSAIYEKFVKDENRINSLGNKIYKKELLSEIYFPDFEMGEDLCVTLQIMYNAKSYIFVDLPYYNYMWIQSSLTSHRNLKSYQDDVETGKYFYEFNLNKCDTLSFYPLSYLVNRLIEADIFVLCNVMNCVALHIEFRKQFNYYFALLCRSRRYNNYRTNFRFYIYKYTGGHVYVLLRRIRHGVAMFYNYIA